MKNILTNLFWKATSRNLLFGLLLIFVAFLLKNFPGNFDVYLVNKFYLTSLVSGAILLFGGFFHSAVDVLVTNRQRKYILKKLISLTGLLIVIFGIGIVWIESVQNIAIFTGFFTVGVGVSFQDVFKSLIGAVIINSNPNVGIGSFIEINGLTGRILDIGFLYTTILEFESFENDGDPIGRYIEFPNSFYLMHNVKSFSKKYEIMWEEILIKQEDIGNSNKIDERIKKYYNNQIKSSFDQKRMEQFLRREKFYLKHQADEIVVFSNYIDGQLYLIVRMLVPFESKKEARSKLIEFILKKG